MTTARRCPTCDGPLTEVDSAALAAEYRAVIDENHRISLAALVQRHDDDIAVHSIASALRAELTPRQAELLAAWWRRQMPDQDGDTWQIADNYDRLADYLRAHPNGYDSDADAQQIVDDFWTAIDPDGTGRADLEAWRSWTGVNVDELAAYATEPTATGTRTAA